MHGRYQDAIAGNVRPMESIAQCSDIQPMFLVSFSSSRVNGGLTERRLGVALACIEDGFTEPVGLVELARLARLSPSHFCRAFRQSVGLRPKRYRGRRRMELAKALLAKRTSVTEVGLVLGYSETSSFATAFHKSTGFTPTAYRRFLSAMSREQEEES